MNKVNVNYRKEISTFILFRRLYKANVLRQCETMLLKNNFCLS